MTDQMIPTDQARRARQWARDTLDDVENGANVSAYARDAARTLIAMMPRPTLADMTPEERAACQWMQADLNGYGSRVVIVNPCWDDGSARVMWMHTRIEVVPQRSITPRPDLPRMTWPGATPTPAPAPALAAMIAGMREEWVGQYLDRNGKWDTICTYPTRKEVTRHLDYLSWDAYTNTRIIRRYVTTPEESK